MHYTPAVYAPPEDLLETDDQDASDQLISNVQDKYNHLYEKYVSLKAMKDSLKEQIAREKQLWIKELKATVDLQAQKMAKNTLESGDSNFNQDEYKKEMKLFRDFMHYRNASQDLEALIQKNNYENMLLELESKCNMELLKIKESMMTLKPLKAIVSSWKKELPEGRNIAATSEKDDTEEESTSVLTFKIN